MEQKYVVRKRDGAPLDPDEFFVIRSSDVFGPAALHGYAHLIQSAIELDGVRPFLEPEEVARLGLLSTHLVDMATEWQRQSKKVPD